MKNLYEVIENGHLGIFESPTGTGKSLSIICGALRWLKDHNERERNEITDNIQSIQKSITALASETTDWINSQAEEIELTHKLNKLKIQQNGITEYDKKIEKISVKKKAKKSKPFLDTIVKPDDLINLENEDEMLLEEINEQDEESENENDTDKYLPVKILICSRTHSQLSQLVGEIIKSPFESETRAVSLASRQNYCINPSVMKLKNMSLINEKCLDMQNKSKKTIKTDCEGKVLKKQKGTTCQCPYNKQENIEDLANAALLDIRDVEDLVTQAKQLNACPYYASRKAAEDAQVVLVPYNTLLHKSTRDASGISLKNNVVIIDEAHNLLEALAQMYSSEITYKQLEETQQRLKNYKQKYSKRFSCHNLLCINQLLFIICSLINLLEKTPKDGTKSEVYTVESFVLNAEIDNYNIFKLLKFCRDSKISNKLHSFAMKYPLDVSTKVEKSTRNKVQEFLTSIENKNKNIVSLEMSSENVVKAPSYAGNPLLSFISFLEALTSSYEDGRVIIYRSDDKKQNRLQFLLLNPAKQFKNIIQDARSVVVAGGTMKPITEFRNRLFIGAGATSERIVEFSCDHIIPPENILPLIITKGQNNENLLFNFENRFSMGKCIKQILQEVCVLITGGIVVFFPSYKYESWVHQQLKDVKFTKPLFREPQDSGSVESTLESYAAAINRIDSTGAILFSVVGGKLSEGLNFSDDLGRCVIVVGLPYANIYSPELKEKMSYLDKTEGKGAGQQFYEALCMKSVNQCIGRAVRHKNDYACVLLLDTRYDRTSTKNSLPGWIKRSLQTCNFTHGTVLIKNFFNDKK
ncbi:hypothetical protein RN001_002360 [Aquatica leii]|uniref:Helicase ATP-binding domain-containing protein n=1 Tax=Aquatica leii TaxID=1421715 RepID=A0AAN7PGV9_9COLE|nr:hypothetical protein RN001_002360 [Aquatica leii]